MKKYTDKYRLDWIQANCKWENGWLVDPTMGPMRISKTDEFGDGRKMYWSIRNAIDDAIRAEKPKQ